MALRRILADPEFIFRFEPTPAGVAAGDAVSHQRHGAGLAAVVLPLVVIPDEELLKLAIDGKLHQPAVLERQTRRMLADPKARSLVTNFANQWLFLRELKNANPDVTDLPGLRRQPASGLPARDRAAVRERHARGPLGARSARLGLHVRERAAGQALRHPERLRSGLPPRAGAQRRAPRPARPRQPAAGHLQPEPHVAGDARQVDPREPARHAGAAAAGRRAAARGEADRDREVRARAHRAAPRQPGVRRLPQDHGPHRPGAGELRRHRPLAHRGRRRHDRRLGAARGRHADQRPGQPAQGAARPSGRVRRVDDREAADVRRRPRDEVLRHAGGAHGDARRGEEPLSVLGSRAGRRQERAVSDEGET